MTVQCTVVHRFRGAGTVQISRQNSASCHRPYNRVQCTIFEAQLLVQQGTVYRNRDRFLLDRTVHSSAQFSRRRVVLCTVFEVQLTGAAEQCTETEETCSVLR
eukprot:Gb_32884 [translate_table: standard]